MGTNQYDDLFGDADQSFDGAYKNELAALKGLTPDQVQSVSPGTTNQETLNQLIQVVQQAQKDNLSQADLIDNIKALGSTAVKLAMKVPKFAALL